MRRVELLDETSLLFSFVPELVDQSGELALIQRRIGVVEQGDANVRHFIGGVLDGEERAILLHGFDPAGHGTVVMETEQVRPLLP